MLKFQYNKQFTTGSGGILTMKALITILGRQYVECHQNNDWHNPEDLKEVKG